MAAVCAAPRWAACARGEVGYHGKQEADVEALVGVGVEVAGGCVGPPWGGNGSH